MFGLAMFCRAFELSAKFQLTGNFSAKMQIILNSFKTDIAHCSAVVADYTHWCSDNTANINVTVRKQLVIVMHETNTMKFCH